MAAKLSSQYNDIYRTTKCYALFHLLNEKFHADEYLLE